MSSNQSGDPTATRRRYLGAIGTAVATSTAGCLGRIERAVFGLPREPTGPELADTAAFDRSITTLMDETEVPGGAIAVAKNGRLVVARGYGLADTETAAPARPDSLFRIASVSKPITAVAILRLVETDRLDLDARAFELLSGYTEDAEWVDPRLEDVTVRQLLWHAGGWDIHQLGIDFEQRHWDPMLNPDTIADAQEVTSPADVETIVRYMVEQRMQFDPGRGFSYSNFGYAVLGRVLEAVTGQSYESFVAEDLLASAGISRMQIGSTRREELADDEVRYYDRDAAGTVDSVFPDEETAPRPYGDFHLEAMDAHGGWIGSPVDLVRFASRLDGEGGGSDLADREPLLSRKHRSIMLRRPDLPRWEEGEEYYAMGWFVRPTGGRDPVDRGRWWHDGSLPGSSSLLVRDAEKDLSIAALFNSRPAALGFAGEARERLRTAIEETSDWPEGDLFDRFD